MKNQLPPPHNSGKASVKVIYAIFAILMTFALFTCDSSSSTDAEPCTHIWNDGVITQDATCIKEGVKTYTCTICKERKTEPLDKSEHSWNDGEVTKETTEEADGEKIFTCTVCQRTKTETIPALDHNHTIDTEWTSDETYHWHKASCNIGEHNEDKAGHSWNNGIVTKEPTEEADGKKIFTCTICQQTKTEAIPALGHNHTIETNWSSNEAHHWHQASCNIGEHNEDKAGHSWENKLTLTDEGKREEKCSICGYVKSSGAWTQETLSELSNALKNYDGTEAKVKVAGTITYTDIAIIKEALNENTSKLVALELNETTGLKIFPAKAFYIDSSSSCKNLISVTIPDGVTEIGEYAFKNCTGLTSVTIPNSLTTIGNTAFNDCKSLTSITIPDKVTKIGISAFNGCTALTSITIPNSVTEISEAAFKNCTALVSIKIQYGVKTIHNLAFSGCTALTNIIIPNNVTKIGPGAFKDCANLKNVTISSNLTEIGSNTFQGCTNLTSVSIPTKVKKIGYSAFERCSSLTNITIPNSVTEILDAAFRDCSSLKSVSIPSSVNSIGWSAFFGCSSLTSVTVLSTTPPTIDSSMVPFQTDLKLENIYVPASAINAYKTADGWKIYANMITSK